MSDEHELVTFRTVGEAVRFDPAAKMWSLTEMHRAAGAPKHKGPAEWLRQQQTQEFMAALVERETMVLAHSFPGAEGRETTGNSGSFVETREGRNGGTWAHWQIAAAYAHYLDPRFYLQWNEWAMAYRTQQTAAEGLEARVAALEGRLTGRGRVKPEGARLILRRTVERIVEEVELRDVPHRPLNDAIRAVLRQAARPLRPIEVTALLRAAGVPVMSPTQVSGALWHMHQHDARLTRDDGRYTLTELDS